MTRNTRAPLALTAAAGLVGAAALGIAYSALAVDRRRRLPPALAGKQSELDTPGGRITLYEADGQGTPLLLIHSINAAASAYEMQPLYHHYASKRPTYAIDLPGFGLSERRDQTYTPRIMVDAILAAVAEIRGRHRDEAVDLMALSLSCEYAARSALEQHDDIRSLALISPTAFDKALAGYGRAQSTKGNPLKLAAISVPLWSRALFDLVVSRPSLRFFLGKAFSSQAIDEGLLRYDHASAHQPGAQHVVWSFLSGYLFADDATRVYKALRLPVWTVHGRRGDFVDFRKEREVADRANWHFAELDTGALPQFERLDELTASYDGFLARLG